MRSQSRILVKNPGKNLDYLDTEREESNSIYNSLMSMKNYDDAKKYLSTIPILFPLQSQKGS